MDCGRQFVPGSRLKCHPNLLRIWQKGHSSFRQVDSELDARCVEQTQDRLFGLYRLKVLGVARGYYAIEGSSQLRVAQFALGDITFGPQRGNVCLCRLDLGRGTIYIHLWACSLLEQISAAREHDVGYFEICLCRTQLRLGVAQTHLEISWIKVRQHLILFHCIPNVC